MDITSISAAIASTKTAIDILKTLSKISKEQRFADHISELQRTILSLNSELLSIQQEQSDLIKIKNELERKLVEYENWENTKSQYELKEIAPQVYVYSMKKAIESTKPNHWLCCKCFNVDHKESILNHYSDSPTNKIYICPVCKNQFKVPINDNKQTSLFSTSPFCTVLQIITSVWRVKI